MDLIPVKFTHHNSTIRNRFADKDLTVSTLQSWIKGEFAVDWSKCRLRYLDEEEMEIDIFSDADLNEATYIFKSTPLNSLKFLRMCFY